MRTTTLFILICLLLPAFARGEEDSLNIRVKGFIDTYHAVRAKSPADVMSSRTRIRGELTVSSGNSGMFASANAAYNALLTDECGFFVREAYLYYAPGDFDIRAGRQIITWGVADALRLTDIISPMDYTEFLAEDYDDIRIPVNAVRARYISSNMSIEAVLTPVNSYYILPYDNANPWSVSIPNSDIPYMVDLTNQPAIKIDNMEYGGRGCSYLSGIDFSVSALRTWNKMPVFSKRLTVSYDTLLITSEHRRLTMLGADVSMPADKFVVRAEVAEYIGEAQEPAVNQAIEYHNSTNMLIGIDWYGSNEWKAGIQYSHKYVDGNLSATTVYRNSGMATMRLSKTLLRNTLNLSTFAYIDVTNYGIFNRFTADYALNDQIHIMLGYDFIDADGGSFMMYKNNSEFWAKLKFSF